MRRPAKKKINRGILGAIGAATIGIVAGAAAVFLSKSENREKVKKVVGSGVKRGKVEVAKATRSVKKLSSKGKKVLKKLR
ncbi:MAG: hypothetical protein UW62_C0021G0003 [Candidatus Collierbacteria bacterium GW2011_GWB1_44_35]|uniref:Uncharacterized protein n=5 Tax=Candidatus Collieribacteriota TaxID=1752725 RepID=A0A0G1HK10_9BACT|nr:MAG: hypothetical protein UW26_C0003G0013 [Candidatus Collierbacteria bacterium GW2011_GWF1_44_12]KKT46913.1 MAG: hypothetical protein UW35_C0006G0018 [Candidatus Collierbacteria bacterium GW2011_GWF2_44_15]KKT67633.1 MAG: hypothetical protein UW62_C0021G0003 [Candidatus Collierbacteria bacterium GW2011_GWB1_44_35]KKT99272.1 MAG: hypothetical protein UW99_C0007G0010 [Candidatus Collierbacteria bacterium GW2011_GWC2_45_15]KKU29783.1 MAG: hypothetical protein UX41_C0012G0008 [Candidatus Collie